EAEQLALCVQPAPISAQGAPGPHHAVARDDDRDRILPVRRSDSPRRRWVPDRSGNLGVTAGFSVRNSQQLFPHAALKRGAPEVQREIELPQLSIEIGCELSSRFCKQRI